MTQPDLKLRADVAVEVMGTFIGTEITPNATYINTVYEMPPYEISRDCCNVVLAEIARRGLLNRLCQILHGQAFDRDYHSSIGADVGPFAGVKVGLNATASQICEAALAAVREAKKSDGEPQWKLPVCE